MAQRQAQGARTQLQTRPDARSETRSAPPASSADTRGEPARPVGGASKTPDVRIERLILHHLDHRVGRCELVDEVATLDDLGVRFFASHVASAAERADWHARFRDDDDAVPGQLHDLLGEEEQFIRASRALAERLYAYMRSRSGSIAPGDFAAIAYRIGSEPTRHVALLKMDPDQQRLVRSFTRQGGHRRVAISVAENLLPEARSLQKCALISRHAPSGAFSVRLLDTQAGPRSDGVAAFFYRDFLAATLIASSRRQTRLFLSETNAWLTQHGAGFQPRELLDFYAARRDALSGEVVRLREFVAAALPQHPDLTPDLERRLMGVVLDDPELRGDHPFFPVDRAAAKSYLEKVTLDLDGGMRLTVSAARFDELVKIARERTDEGKVVLTLESMVLREVAG
ncbi:MAG TPA: nucleoid-associated protein [Ktedonobacterales bacterium]|nr:nucleoid-associated protein [Ktedonobacterales bacterium]